MVDSFASLGKRNFFNPVLQHCRTASSFSTPREKVQLLIREAKESHEKVKLKRKAKRALTSAFGPSGNRKGTAEDCKHCFMLFQTCLFVLRLLL